MITRFITPGYVVIITPPRVTCLIIMMNPPSYHRKVVLPVVAHKTTTVRLLTRLFTQKGCDFGVFFCSFGCFFLQVTRRGRPSNPTLTLSYWWNRDVISGISLQPLLSHTLVITPPRPATRVIFFQQPHTITRFILTRGTLYKHTPASIPPGDQLFKTQKNITGGVIHTVKCGLLLQG